MERGSWSIRWAYDRRPEGDHVLLAPPFIVTAAQIDEIVDRLGGGGGRRAGVTC